MDDVRRKYSQITAAYGRYFPLSALITYIIMDVRNKKPLYILRLPLPMKTSGFCIGLADCDIIGIRAGLNEAQQLITILHEMSHFILRHVKLYTSGYEKRNLQHFLLSLEISDIKWDSFLKHDTIQGYSNKIELDAEILATLLSNSIIDMGTVPNIIRDLYRIRG